MGWAAGRAAAAVADRWPAGNGPAGATVAAGGPSAAADQAVTWESLSLVIRQDSPAGSLQVLIMARGRNPGPRQLAGFWLPWIEGAEPAGPQPLSDLSWRPQGWYDPRPLAAGESRSYTYQVRIPPSAGQQSLRLHPRGPVEELLLLTREGELQAFGEGLRDRGLVDGEALGLSDVQLHAYRATELAPSPWEVTVAPSEGVAAENGTAPLPDSASQDAQAPAGVPGRGVPYALLGVLAGGLAWLGWRQSQGPAGWERRRQRLVSAMVELDQAHQAGEVPAEVYRRERQRLLQEAVRLTLKIQDHRTATQAGAPVAPKEAGLGNPSPPAAEPVEPGSAIPPGHRPSRDAGDREGDRGAVAR